MDAVQKARARPSSEYDVITALPDSVVTKPLGLIEEREPRELTSGVKAAASRTGAPGTSPVPDALLRIGPGDWDREAISPSALLRVQAAHLALYRIELTEEHEGLVGLH